MNIDRARALMEERALLSTAALKEATLQARTSAPRETGGILIGYWSGTDPVVAGFLPVPDQTAGRRHYVRRHALAQQALREHLLAVQDERLGYIGEWHSHPEPQPPSGVDHRALRDIVKTSRKSALLIVLAVATDGTVSTHALMGRPRWPFPAIHPTKVRTIDI